MRANGTRFEVNCLHVCGIIAIFNQATAGTLYLHVSELGRLKIAPNTLFFAFHLLTHSAAPLKRSF